MTTSDETGKLSFSASLSNIPTLTTVMVHLPASVIIVDTEMNIIAASKKWLQRYGFKEEEVIGKNNYELLLNISDEWRNVHKRCLAGATEKKDHDILRMPDGTEEIVRWEVTPWKNDQDQIGGIIIYSEIITETETVRLSNTKMLRELNMLNEVGFVIYNATDDFDMIDEVCKKIIFYGGYQLVWFGFAPDPLHEKQLISPIHKYGSAVHYLDNFLIDLNNAEQSKGPTATALKTGKTVVVNNLLDSPLFSPWLQNARKHNIQSSISLPITLNDGQKCVLCIYSGKKDAFDKQEVLILERLAVKITYSFNDIKRRYENKLAQIEQAKLIKDLSLRNRSLEDFTYLVSHNLRAKVADLLGVSNLIADHNLSEEDTKELNGEVGRIAQKLDEVIRDLHNTLLVKVQNLLNSEQINLSVLFDYITHSISYLVPSTKINFNLDFSENNFIKTDRYYLCEACTQLLLGIIKHQAVADTTIINITSKVVGNKVQLIVEDDQIGFNLKDTENTVFTVYKKLYQHLTGGGIKLLYVKAIIEHIGGVFYINCEVQKNIKFMIEFDV